MSERELNHRGFDLVLHEEAEVDLADVPTPEAVDGEPVHMTISEERVDAWRLEGGKYFSRHLPYTVYDTVEDLARAIVDHSPDYDTQEDGPS